MGSAPSVLVRLQNSITLYFKEHQQQDTASDMVSQIDVRMEKTKDIYKMHFMAAFQLSLDIPFRKGRAYM